MHQFQQARYISCLGFDEAPKNALDEENVRKGVGPDLTNAFLVIFFWPNVKPVYHSYSLIMAEVYHNMYLAHGLKPSNSAHQRSQPDTLAHLWQPLEGRNVCRSQLTESARRCDGNPKAAPWVVVNGACS